MSNVTVYTVQNLVNFSSELENKVPLITDSKMCDETNTWLPDNACHFHQVHEIENIITGSPS